MTTEYAFASQITAFTATFQQNSQPISRVLSRLKNQIELRQKITWTDSVCIQGDQQV